MLACAGPGSMHSGALLIGLSEIGLADLSAGANGFRRARSNRSAIDKNCNPVSESEHRFHVVLDQEDGQVTLQRAQHLDHVGGLFRPQPSHWFIEQQHARLAGKRHGQFEQTVFPMT